MDILTSASVRSLRESRALAAPVPGSRTLRRPNSIFPRQFEFERLVGLQPANGSRTAAGLLRQVLARRAEPLQGLGLGIPLQPTSHAGPDRIAHSVITDNEQDLIDPLPFMDEFSETFATDMLATGGPPVLEVRWIRPPVPRDKHVSGTGLPSRGTVPRYEPPRQAPLPPHAVPEQASTERPAAPPRGGQASTKDRRAHPRRESGCTVAVCPRLPGSNLISQQVTWRLHSARIKGHLLDVSMSGMALQVNEPLPPKSSIYLRITNRQFDQHVDATATVLRSTQECEDEWLIICRLDKHLTFEQVNAIGKHLFSSTVV